MTNSKKAQKKALKSAKINKGKKDDKVKLAKTTKPAKTVSQAKVGLVKFSEVLPNLKGYIETLGKTYGITNNSIRWTDGVRATSPTNQGDNGNRSAEINKGGYSGIAPWSLLVRKGRAFNQETKSLLKKYTHDISGCKFNDTMDVYSIVSPSDKVFKTLIKNI